jgi:riboflavin kinase/FMN adenylyltransferase
VVTEILHLRHVNGKLALSGERPVTYESPHEYVVAMGNFDGVHRGHAEIIRTCVQMSQEMAVKSMIVTFQPHPRRIISSKPHYYLTTLEHKLDLLRQYRPDVIAVIEFDEAVVMLSAVAFIEQMVTLFAVKHVVTGIDFRFGCERLGDAELLARLGRQYGFSYQALRRMILEHQPLSSSYIKNLLHWGAIRSVSRFLGREYSIKGQVERGAGVAREKLGAATANIQLDQDLQLPLCGVYLGRLRYQKGNSQAAGNDNRDYVTLCNIGKRPTLNRDDGIWLEAHVLDEDLELYDSRITVVLEHFLRPERAFSDIIALQRQIELDKGVARYILSQDLHAGRG